MNMNKHQPMTLWYRQSAARLNEALPIGNGKMAAMVYGGAETEKIQFDDATFWSGEPSRENNRADTPEILQKLRGLLMEHHYGEADRAGKDFVGAKRNYGTHMPLGDLIIGHVGLKGAAGLERSLDLFDGVASASFAAGGCTWNRECFMSYPAEVFSLRYGADSQKCFSVALQWEGIENDTRFIGLEGRDVLLAGNARETLHSDGRAGVSLRGRIRVLTDGEVAFCGGSAEIRNATGMVLLASLETTMTSPNPDAACLRRLDGAERLGWRQLLSSHVADVHALMERVSFSLGEGRGELPADERIAAHAAGKEDPSLIALAFQYGRYLTLASSRRASPLPTHMGGIWNDNIYNKQDSTQDMHIDMNLQMQYWPAFPCGLAECFWPAARWMRDVLVPAGEEAARVAYGAGGWVAHVTSNPWGYAALGWAHNWGSFSFGGAWCAALLWDYFDYTRDMDFLREIACPILLGAARFMLDVLFYDEDSGCWMCGPSYSPENHYSVDGEPYTLSLSTTCDILLIREIFTLALKSARLAGAPEDEMQREIAERLKGLPSYRIGKWGQIQEWLYDFEESDPCHRHASHLLGLYPFAQISPEGTPALAKAARVSIRRRLEGFEATSWGYNLFAGMFARLHDGDAAKEMVDENIRRLAMPNLTIAMPADVPMWGGTWELDGNTGLSAAVCEMIAQSREAQDRGGESYYEVRLLPALPRGWPDGEMRGLRLRGGFALDIIWRGGKLACAALTAAQGSRLAIAVAGCGGAPAVIVVRAGETLEIGGE
jgi:alpha-L-fucosidase 2